MNAEQTVNEMRFRMLINSMADGVIALNPDNTISLYNAALLDLLNSNTGLEKRPITEVLEICNDKHEPVDIQTLLSNTHGTQISRDHLIKVHDEYLNILLTISRVDGGFGHDDDSYLIMLRDITKEKSLEEERDEFISVVSHELRTPIAIAEGNVSNAQFAATKDKASKIIIDELNTAHEQVVFLSDLLNDLSMLSRAERGMLQVELEEIDIAALLNELRETYTRDAAKQHLTITVEIEGQLPKLRSAELYVREILQNFITNALKYTPQGTVAIRAKAETDQSVTVSVSDSGIGMSAHDLKHIFEKFYRSEDYRTRERSGTGLGLYVTQKLISMLHAKLEVTSKLNEGSTFSVTFSQLSQKPRRTEDD